MQDPHVFNRILLVCVFAAAALLFIFLVVALVPKLRHHYLNKLFPFTARVIRLGWWSCRVFYTWGFKRISPKFTIPLLFLLVVFFCVYPYAAYSLFELPPIPFTMGGGAGYRIAWIIAGTLLRLLIITGSSLIAVGLVWVWLNLSFLIACSIYRNRRRPVPTWLQKWLDSAAKAPASAGGVIVKCAPEISAKLEKFERIGIILAGGGAKGAYQAGALRAIHQFLSQYGALDRVKMIAGTSIGSWNALFWLAGLIGREGEQDPLELWWSNIDLAGLIEPAKYAPGQNFFLSNQPWQDQFNEMFLTGPFRGRLERHVRDPRDERSIHFYFTRTNVGKARLEFTTNREDLDRVKAEVLGRPTGERASRRWTVAACVEDIRFAVFSSMTLPPLFQYMTTYVEGDPKRIEYYEDGGVIDNLPIAFGTEVEGCDLLFVLPLNASFEEPVDPRWMLRRLLRVINIRQGVLEQKSLDELQRLNEAYDGRTATAGKPVSVFAICPEDNALVSTAQFWNRGGASEAFNLMYRATRKSLRENFVETVSSRDVSVLLVDAKGEVRPREI